MLSKDYKNGVLKINDDVFTKLKPKHSPAADLYYYLLSFGPLSLWFFPISLLVS